ncbi:MAG: putative transcriptional regulatory protein YxjL [Chloroflexota bacterium]
MCESVRVLVVDDHPIVRQGLRALIAATPGLVPVGEAGDGDEAVRLAAAAQPDVIVMDLVMPGSDGVAAIGELKSLCPDTRVLVFTGYADDEKVLGAIRMGALGYLLKDSSPQDVLRAIREVARGEASLHPAVARRLIHELNQDQGPHGEPLTERELEVLRLVAHGLSNQEIADRCTISERTVRTHVSSILSKLHLSSRTQATLYALRQGIAHLESA